MYDFSNSYYLRSHGKAPRGTGHWAFEIRYAHVQGLGNEVMYDQVSSFREDTIFWVPGVCTLTEAKKKAAEMAAAAGVPSGTTLYVAP